MEKLFSVSTTELLSVLKITRKLMKMSKDAFLQIEGSKDMNHLSIRSCSFKSFLDKRIFDFQVPVSKIEKTFKAQINPHTLCEGLLKWDENSTLTFSKEYNHIVVSTEGKKPIFLYSNERLKKIPTIENQEKVFTVESLSKIFEVAHISFRRDRRQSVFFSAKGEALNVQSGDPGAACSSKIAIPYVGESWDFFFERKAILSLEKFVNKDFVIDYSITFQKATFSHCGKNDCQSFTLEYETEKSRGFLSFYFYKEMTTYLKTEPLFSNHKHNTVLELSVKNFKKTLSHVEEVSTFYYDSEKKEASFSFYCEKTKSESIFPLHLVNEVSLKNLSESKVKIEFLASNFDEAMDFFKQEDSFYFGFRTKNPIGINQRNIQKPFVFVNKEKDKWFFSMPVFRT